MRSTQKDTGMIFEGIGFYSTPCVTVDFTTETESNFTDGWAVRLLFFQGACGFGSQDQPARIFISSPLNFFPLNTEIR